MTDELQARLGIAADNLQAINQLLLDPDNRVVRAFLDVVRKYGTPEEINAKAEAARDVTGIRARLSEMNSPYLRDLEWLIEQRDQGAFVNQHEYRYSVLGHRADLVAYDEACFVVLEISGFQYFPWLIAEARRAIEAREVMPGSFIRARKLKESEQDQGELPAVVAAMQIMGSDYYERLETRELAEVWRLNTPGSIVRYLSGSTQLDEYALKWLDEFLYFYTNYGVSQVVNANAGTVLLGYLLFRLGVNTRFRISASLGTDNPFAILWALTMARLLARPDGTSPLAGLNLNDMISRETLDWCADVRRALGMESTVGLEYHVTETWKNSVKQPYLRRAELLHLAWMIPNIVARHEGADPEIEQTLSHPSDLFDYLLDKPRVEASGEMPLLERNYLEKHAALNRTARALTQDGLSIVAAPRLHGCPCPEIPHGVKAS